MELRKFTRFFTDLKVEANPGTIDSVWGQMRDFTREGCCAVFDNFELGPNSSINLRIQKPGEDVYASATAEVMWKKPTAEKCEVGFKLKDILPSAKAEILEYGYKYWLRHNSDIYKQ